MLSVEGSGLRLLPRPEQTDAAQSLSYFARISDPLRRRLAVGDGNVDCEEGVSGAMLEPASEC